MAEPYQSWNRKASAKSQDAVSIRFIQMIRDECPEKTAVSRNTAPATPAPNIGLSSVKDDGSWNRHVAI